MKLYCLYDRKSNTYGTVFTSDNNITAVRYFLYLCSLPVNEMVRDDVELYCLADYDSKNGLISNVNKEFISNFIYDESFTNYIRKQAREELLEELAMYDNKEVNINEE